MKTKIIAFIITVILIYLACSYYNNQGTTAIVEIYPDKAITKIRPSDADGIIIKNIDDSLYENLGSKAINNKKVTLLPEPEEPIDIKSLEQGTEDHVDPLNVIFSELEINLPDKADINKLNTKLKVVHVEDNSHTVSTIKKPDIKRSDLYKIQLASVKTQSEASLEWDRIKRTHPKILGNVKVTFKKVNHENGKFFYLIIAGNYENLSQAKAVCKKLSLRQQSCIVTR